MIGRTNVGGGANLNFKVVGGTTEPASPKENTIWVNTDTAITSYVFAAAEPAEPVEGMVWITTGNASSAEFNALKKNCIQVYPLSAAQYVSGAWAAKPVQTYRSGAWTDFATYLYHAGNTFNEVTGGWVGYAKGQTSSSGNATKPTAKYNSDNVVITCDDEGDWASGMWCTKNKIALTEKSKLVFDGFRNAAKVYLAVWSALGEYTKDNLAAEKEITKTTRSTIELDVSSMSGSYYVGLRFIGSQSIPKVTMFGLKAE